MLPGDTDYFPGDSTLRTTALLDSLSYLPSTFFLQLFSPDLLLSLNKKKTLSLGLELFPVNKVHGALRYSLDEVNFAFLDQVCVVSN